MVSPRKEHSGATKALRKWHKRCRDPKKSADDILDLALKALDDAHGGGRALLARGAGERTAALLLRAAARKMRTTPPAYLRSVAWSLNELDAFEAAALRLKARLLPGQPDYARLRLARDAARVAAGRAPAWPLIEDDDAAAHAAMPKLAEVADARASREWRLLGAHSKDELRGQYITQATQRWSCTFWREWARFMQTRTARVTSPDGELSTLAPRRARRG